MVSEIVIHPFGEIDRPVLEAVRAAVKRSFGIETAVGEELDVPPQAYSPKRRQYLSTEFLNRLAARPRADTGARLGVTGVDLFVPELNFVFGEASRAERVAVFSVARLDPRAYGGPEDETKLLRRAETEAVHELGHVFGLGHCTSPRCVMWFSNTLSETDRKGSDFCPRCAGQLGSAGRSRQ